MHDHHHYTNRQGLRTAFFLNMGFTLLELVGGIITNSVAITADALHDLGDSLSLGLAWFLDRYAGKQDDERYSYGYRRFSLLGALINALIQTGGSVIILAEKVPRLLDPQPGNAPGMIVFALVGMAANGAAVFALRGGESMNEQVGSLHLLEDVLGWAAVFVASVVLFFTGWTVLDPILSVLVTGVVLYGVVRAMRRTVDLFLQAVPEGIDLEDIATRITTTAGVLSAHHTHIWSLDGDHNVLTTHVVVPADLPRADVLEVKRQIAAIAAELHCEHVTIEVEFEGEDCCLDMTPVHKTGIPLGDART
ncbi:MAG: cation transporter [Chloroflexi bacterium]|nr:cation transporter [Chloroflexota bacterium]